MSSENEKSTVVSETSKWLGKDFLVRVIHAGKPPATLATAPANLALGLVISTMVQTQFQAMQVTVFFLMPSILLSGFMFPFDGMPRAAQWIAEILPMTHFMRLIRGVILRGATLPELSTELAILAGFILIAMAIAILRFNKRLD